MAAAVADTPKMDEQVDLTTIPVDPAGKEDSSDVKDDDKPVTVFHDKDNFNVKHPLQNKWTLWFTKPPSGKVRNDIPLPPNSDTNIYDRATTGTIS
jgi:translation initiation factor 4E